MRPLLLTATLTMLAMSVAGPARAATAPVRLWRATLDLRTLPAHTMPATVAAVIDGADAVRAGARPVVALAINGVVVAHRLALADGPTPIDAIVEDRLLAIDNTFEVSVSLPGCQGDACAEAIAAVRLRGPLRARLGRAIVKPTDFYYLASRLRAGVEIDAADAAAARLAGMAMAALAPDAPLRRGAAGAIVVAVDAPAGTRPALRFDMGPVRLLRSDGAVVVPADALAHDTVVQMLSRGGRSILWIRPGDAVPARFDLSSGNVAVFDRGGRVIAFAPERDDAVAIAYASGADALGRDRRVRLWRLGLLGVWLAATLVLGLFVRRLPRPRRLEFA